jgi:hypothetical protein
MEVRAMDDKQNSDVQTKQIDKLKEALRKRDLTVFTPEAILKVFEEEGYYSLEDYARKLAEVIRGQKGIPQRIDVDRFRRTPEPRVGANKHRVLEVPFTANGVVYDPKDISRFDGIELFYVDGKDGLLVYTDMNASDMLLQTFALTNQVVKAMHEPPRPNHILGPDESEPYKFPWQNYEPHPGGIRAPLPIPPAPPRYHDPLELFMWDDMNFSGNRLELAQGLAMPDLSECYTWPFGSGWNDCISSIEPTSSYGVFYEDVNFQGTRMLSNGNPYLASIGWNDRISSVRCIPAAHLIYYNDTP